MIFNEQRNSEHDTESLPVEKNLGENPSPVSIKELEWKLLEWDFWILDASGFVTITLWHCGAWIYYTPLITTTCLYSPMTAKTES